ncbi:MAG TPA: type VI secretion system tube protein Hcp [Bryobacteraceae bacterium]|nr:type VI secretion system tube protein Hcp [Bryobacteraceae bacterium]
MAFDAFLKLNGIAGESTDDKHKGEIEIYSFSWGASNPTTIGSGTSGVGAGKVSISSFNIMKKTDKASPTLFQNCCSGKHIPDAVVILRKAGGTAVEYLTYKFSELMVESIQWSGSAGGDDTPTESVSFAFGKCTIDYQPQGKDGSPEGGPVHGGWSLTTNVKA